MKLSYIAAEMADDFEESIRLGASAHADGVALRNKVFGKALEELTEEEIDTAKKILSEYGLAVTGLYSGIGKCSIDDPETARQNRASFSRILDAARAFDTNLIRVFPYQRSGVEEYEPSRLDDYLEMIGEAWTPLVRQAEQCDVVLCFEGVGSTLARTSADMKRVVDVLGRSRAVGVIWEVDVAFRDGEMPSVGYEMIKDLIRDVHIKPHPDLPLSGDGESYEQVITSLCRDGYEGAVTIEHWTNADESIIALEELRGLLDRLHRGGSR